MGRHTVEALARTPDLNLIAKIDRGMDIRAELISARPDVTIDFTSAELGPAHTKLILEAGSRPVIGTSGFTEEDFVFLKVLAEERGLGGIIAPNFSIGALLMMRMASLCAPFFKACEIIELHHDKKKDAPSGTAQRTAELLSKDLPTTPPIHSIRLPGLLAHQKILFGGPGELLTIGHDATSRETYMPGVVLACRAAMTLSKLVFGLEHILFDTDAPAK